MHYAFAGYQSVRHFMPTTQVAFIFDGVAPAEMKSLPMATVVDASNFPDDELRGRLFGTRSGLAKLACFFAAPFTSFLYIDADALVVGDGRNNWETALDLVYHKASVGSLTDEQITQYFFDTRLMSQHFPHFDWCAFREDFFCTGSFYARRGLIDRGELISVLDVSASEPKLFKYMEQGILNYLFFKGVAEGAIRARGICYQYIGIDHKDAELKRLFTSAMAGDESVSCAFHYPGAKPHVLQRRGWVSPMTRFRYGFWRTTGRLSPINAVRQLSGEDIRHFYLAKLRSTWRKVNAAIGSLRRAPQVD